MIAKPNRRVTVILAAKSPRRCGRPSRARPTWRDRSYTVMILRWWRARIIGHRTIRKARRRRDG